MYIANPKISISYPCGHSHPLSSPRLYVAPGGVVVVVVVLVEVAVVTVVMVVLVVVILVLVVAAAAFLHSKWYPASLGPGTALRKL